MNILQAIGSRANSIRKGIARGLADYGASGLRAISYINPVWGGKVAHAADVVGRGLGNPLPQATGYGSGGATAAMESFGGQPTASTSEAQRQALESKARSNSGGRGSAVSTAPSRVTGGNNGIPARDYTKPGNWGFETEGHWFQTPQDYYNWKRNQSSSSSLSPSPSRKLGKEGVRSIASKIPGVTNEDLAKMDLSKWANETSSNADEIARQIEETARANAEREYNTIKDALGVQKGEVKTLARQQKENLAKQKKLTEEGLTEKQTSEVKGIEKQKKGFQQEEQFNEEALASNWRDLSMKIQAAMRAGGVGNSSYAYDKDAKLQLDFNKGLRQLKVKAAGALKDFSDAVIETNKYYTRQKAQLDFNYNRDLESVDTFVRENVQRIQAQEGVALSKKLTDIKNAVLKGNQLKAQVAQKIADQQLGLAVWMKQFQLQLKASVATAAKGKTQDAWKNIAAVRQNTNIIKTVLENGGEFVKRQNANGQPQWFVHGPVIHGDGTFTEQDFPVTEGFVQLETMKNAKATSANGGLLGMQQGPTYQSAWGLLAPPGLTPPKTNNFGE